MKSVSTFLIFAFGITLFFISGGVSAQNLVNYIHSINEHRAQYKADFLSEDRSPLTESDLARLDFFAPDKNWNIQCEFERTPNAKPFELPTYSGITKPYIQYGWLKFEKDGKMFQLAVYESMRLRMMPKYKDHLFLPFKDLTNGESTYGGGRYLDLSKKDIKRNNIAVDFNKAYNPWCAYSDGYNCPIPPSDNHLTIAVPAGEKQYRNK